MTTLCLNMIVKNESHVIEKTLTRLMEVFPITYWVISDTGSTDNTKEVIQNFFKKRNIQGELVEHEWRDFGYNRTKALESAYAKTDYLLIFDADDYVHGNLILPSPLDKDFYYLQFGSGFIYKRPLLVNNHIKWEFIGVLHEYLIGHKDNKTEQHIEGDYFIESGKSGSRSMDPQKYLKDAMVLEKAYNTEENYTLKQRYAFYCAQSFMDANIPDKSIEWYKKVVNGGNWNQEKYYACLMIAKQSIDNNPIQAIEYLSKAEEYDSERIEHVVRMIEFFYGKGMHHMVNMLYKNHKNYREKNGDIHSKLFLSLYEYEYKMEHLASISSYYIGDLKNGYECCKVLLNNKDVPTFMKSNTMNNMIFYKDYILNDSIDNVVMIFHNYNDMIKNINIEDSHLFIWNLLFSKSVDTLTMYNKKNFPNVNFNSSKTPNIILTMTTCKRYDLFQKTINSILNQWTDLNLIDYWFCVDDNSSEQDKNNMLSNYPFFDFYFKDSSQKGHRASMNIIWDKLNQLKPKYWIHMEDDFLFFDKMEYISKSIQGIETMKHLNVKQVLFNRGYGEIVDDYKIKSFIEYSRDYCIHDFRQNVSVNYPNCHYWPHYSFRPSLIDVETILQLGNFDTENQFFEMDYACKWTNAGFKSAFFNKITNRHIGRLTSERNDKTLPNAYELNDESQFVEKIEPEKHNTNTNTNNPFIKVINLERRTDRKQNAIKCFLSENLIEGSDYEFIKGIDGKLLKSDYPDLKLFLGNDFANRRGVIGCALTHYYLWKQLLDDKEHDFYLIMEDDFTLCKDFKNKLRGLKLYMREKEYLFIGYHMFDAARNGFKDIYNSESNDIIIQPLNKELYIGGFFCYSLNKVGAQKMIDYINLNGIKHGIDYLNKIIPHINNFEVVPQLCFSGWNEGGREIDSDIQNKYSEEDLIEIKTKIIAFHDNCLCERGTTISVYDYARYNEEILGNISLILYEKNNLNNVNAIIQKFTNRFKVYAYEKWDDVDNFLKNENCNILYLQKSGENDNKLSTVCKNVVHCVFNTSFPQGDVYARISDSFGDKKYPVVPYIVDLPNINTNMRSELNIPENAIVFGRHGGLYQFDINYVQKCVYDVASINPNIYFIFVNTAKFCNTLPNIIHLDKIIDLEKKTSFINTCDAMIWGRSDGETFGLAIAEFSIRNKPIIATICGDRAHVDMLKDNAFWYSDYESLHDILINFGKNNNNKDWNMYKQFSPVNVMSIFNEVFIKDNDILNLTEINENFVFFPNLDQIDYDLIYVPNASIYNLMKLATNNTKCVAFNSLGFFKYNIVSLTKSPYLNGKGHGIYVKKSFYEKYIMDNNIHVETKNEENTEHETKNELLRIKMLCNWTSSEELCKEWSNMCETNNKWKNIEIVSDDNNVDYYVIINKPCDNSYYDPKKTLVFQMEPWVYDNKKNWGVKTWGEWAKPNESKFLYVGSHKNYLNNVQWQITIPKQITDNKQNKIITFLSEKNFDDGHIKRIDFLKFLERKKINVDVYGRKNYHSLKCYVGQLKKDKKESQLPNYKYCLSVENNFEENYATEKIWEGILCENLCFYWGCPNLETYIDPKAFVRLDLNDFNASFNIIKKAISEDWWSKRIEIIRKEKERLLNKLGFFPRLRDLLNRHIDMKKNTVESIRIIPNQTIN